MVPPVNKYFKKHARGFEKTMSSFYKGILHGMFYATILWAAIFGWMKILLRYLGYDV